MKVIYIANSGKIQGAGKALLNIVSNIKNYNISPIVVLPERGPIVEELCKRDIKTYIFYYRNAVLPPSKSIMDKCLWLPRLLFTLLVNYIAETKFNKVVCSEQPMIIHSNSGVIHFGSKIASKHHIPHVWHIREYQKLDFGWTPIGGMPCQRKRYAERNNHCISITKDIFRYYKLNVTKDYVVYDGVFYRNTNTPRTPKGKYILFVGCLKEGKGILDLFNSFDAMSDDDIKHHQLWMAGKNECNIERMISNSNHPERYKYLGFRDDIYALMSGAVALVVPSISEGFGFITVEAMLNHCLVIGTNTGGTKEQFDNGVEFSNTEIGVRYETNTQLMRCISDAINQNSTIEHTILKAYDTVLNLYSIEKNIDSLLSIYRNLISE